MTWRWDVHRHTVRRTAPHQRKQNVRSATNTTMPTNASLKSWTVCTAFAPSVCLRSWTWLKEQASSCAPFADIRRRSQIQRCQPCLMTLISCPTWPCRRSPGALTTLGRCSWLQRVSPPPPARLQTPPAAWSSPWRRSSRTQSGPLVKTPLSLLSRAWSLRQRAPTGPLSSAPLQSSATMSRARLCGCWASCILVHCLWESICWCCRKWHWASWALAWCRRASPSACSMSSAACAWGHAWLLLIAYWSSVDALEALLVGGVTVLCWDFRSVFLYPLCVVFYVRP